MKNDRPLLICICAASLLVASWYGEHIWLRSNSSPASDLDRQSLFFGQVELAYTLHALPPRMTNSAEVVAQRLNSVFESRARQYDKHLSTLNAYLVLQGVFAIVTLIAIFGREDFVELDKLGIKVQRSIALSLLPVLLMLFWAHFGFTFSETIDLRMGLWKVAEAMEAPAEAFRSRSTGANQPSGAGAEGRIGPETRERWKNASYTYGQRRALHDGGIMDGWFHAFRSAFTFSTPAMGMVHVHVIVWAILIAMVHATTLVSIVELAKCAKTRLRRKLCLYGFLPLAMLYLLLSHFGFMRSGGHPNWMQSIILCATALLFLILSCRSAFHRRLRTCWFRMQAKLGDKGAAASVNAG